MTPHDMLPKASYWYDIIIVIATVAIIITVIGARQTLVHPPLSELDLSMRWQYLGHTHISAKAKDVQVARTIYIRNVTSMEVAKQHSVGGKGNKGGGG